MFQNYNPEDKIKTCKLLESGMAFQPEGIYCCCCSTVVSPRLFSDKELSSGVVSPEGIMEKRKELFHYLNTNDHRAGSCLTCSSVYETQFKNVHFDRIEGVVNIQPFSLCNLRCKYCLFTQKNNFCRPSYNIFSIYELLYAYKKLGKVHGAWLTVNGGEPAILKDFGMFCEKLVQLDIGSVCIFSNCVKYEKKFADLLHDDNVFLTVSLDSGVPTTFAEVRGAPAMWKVVDTIIRYRKTGTRRLFIKYIITKDNCNEDDLFGFVFLMTSLRPDIVYICPEFPYGDKETPHEFVLFGARLWYLLKKYGDMHVYIQTDDNLADPKFKKYSEEIRKEFNNILLESPLDDTFILPSVKLAMQAVVKSFRSYIKKKLLSYKKISNNK